MDKLHFTTLISNKVKLIRTEYDYSQEKMAQMLGISKKTLVQIEKGRVEAGWTVVVALCALFHESEVLTNALGDDPLELARLLAQDEQQLAKNKTLGGKVWWEEVSKSERFLLQRNLISNHFRILDEEHYRVYSTFDEIDAKKRFIELNIEMK